MFYQLDFIQVRIDSMCFINSIFREDRLDSRPLGEKASFEGGLISRLSMAVGARLRQGTETLESTGRPTAGQSS